VFAVLHAAVPAICVVVHAPDMQVTTVSQKSAGSAPYSQASCS
jgi:hypothetical protein